MPDVAADDDVAAFHGDAAARGGVLLDHHETAVAGRPGALGDVALYAHHARHDVLGHAPADVAVDRDLGPLVHAADVVAGVAHDLDFDRRVQPDGDVVRPVGVEDPDLLNAVFGQPVVQVLVEVAYRGPAEIPL